MSRRVKNMSGDEVFGPGNGVSRQGRLGIWDSTCLVESLRSGDFTLPLGGYDKGTVLLNFQR